MRLCAHACVCVLHQLPKHKYNDTDIYSLRLVILLCLCGGVHSSSTPSQQPLFLYQTLAKIAYAPTRRNSLLLEPSPSCSVFFYPALLEGSLRSRGPDWYRELARPSASQALSATVTPSRPPVDHLIPTNIEGGFPSPSKNSLAT